MVSEILEEADGDRAKFERGHRLHDPEADRDQGGNPPDFWDREHVGAKSLGFPSASQIGACDKDARAKNQCLCLNGTRVAQVSDTLAIDLNLGCCWHRTASQD